MLEHSERNDVIVAAVDLAIILQLEGYRQGASALTTQPDLFFRHRHAGRNCAALLGCVNHERAPAATDVEHMLTWFKIELAADEIEFCLLCLIQVPWRGGSAPVSAGI